MKLTLMYGPMPKPLPPLVAREERRDIPDPEMPFGRHKGEPLSAVPAARGLPAAGICPLTTGGEGRVLTGRKEGYFRHPPGWQNHTMGGGGVKTRRERNQPKPMQRVLTRGTKIRTIPTASQLQGFQMLIKQQPLRAVHFSL